MAIKTLWKINTVDYTGEILTPFKVGRNKLWGDDTGRVMSGEMKGSLVGIFPKFTVIFMPKTEAKMASLMAALDTAFQTVEYYDIQTQSFKSLGTYTSDYEFNIVSN